MSISKWNHVEWDCLQTIFSCSLFSWDQCSFERATDVTWDCKKSGRLHAPIRELRPAQSKNKSLPALSLKAENQKGETIQSSSMHHKGEYKCTARKNKQNSQNSLIGHVRFVYGRINTICIYVSPPYAFHVGINRSNVLIRQSLWTRIDDGQSCAVWPFWLDGMLTD